MTPDEEWRPIAGYEGHYEVSSLGRVRSLARTVNAGPPPGVRQVPAVMLRQTLRPNGYLQVTLSKRSFMVHALVATAFIGPRQQGLETCHNDGVATNNVLTNLRYDTVSENRLDTVRHGNNVASNRTHCPQGHAYDAANTGRAGKRARRCLTCHRIRERARYHARAS